MNYMLTGEKGIGKSTVIKKVLQELDMPFGGFCTTFGDCRHERDRLLCMYRADCPSEIGEANAVAVFSPKALLYGCPLGFS